LRLCVFAFVPALFPQVACGRETQRAKDAKTQGKPLSVNEAANRFFGGLRRDDRMNRTKRINSRGLPHHIVQKWITPSEAVAGVSNGEQIKPSVAAPQTDEACHSLALTFSKEARKQGIQENVDRRFRPPGWQSPGFFASWVPYESSSGP